MRRLLVAASTVIVVAGFAYLVIRLSGFGDDARSPVAGQISRWAGGNPTERAALVTTQRNTCPGAPFILPSDGFIGLLYADPNGPYSADSPHQGIDIFSNTPPGMTPVYAAYDGFIGRESDWRSALIQRVPDDPLNHGRQVWLYYAHMADRDGNSYIVSAFPPGTSEVFVEQGTLLGYTGDYNGNSPRDIWVHLHFSIVLDDGRGHYTNELAFANTVDPSPYLGLPLNYACSRETIQCSGNLDCMNRK